MTDFILLHKLFTSLYTDVEGERNAAASRVRDFLLRNKIHPVELRITPAGSSVYEEFGAARQILETEITRLANQLNYARQHLDDAALRTLNRMAGETSRWPEVEALLIEKIGVDGALPNHWRKYLTSVAGCSSYTLSRWLDGLVPIPDAVVAKLAAQPVEARVTPKAKPAKVKQKKKSGDRAPVFPWTAKTYCAALELLMNGKGLSGTAKHFGINDSQISSKFDNQAPAESLLPEPIIIHTSGPMNLLELWKIGFTLYGTGWKKSIETLFGLSKRNIRWNPPLFTEAQCNELREKWHAHQKQKSSEHQLRQILDHIRAAGVSGTIYEQSPEAVNELEHNELIFDSKKRGGKNRNSVMWVAAEFREHYP